METKRHIPGWVILVLVLAVALAAIITIATLRQQADESQQAVILLSRLEVLSNKLSALEWSFQRKPEPEVLEEVQAVESQIDQALDGLMKLDPSDERLQRLSKAQLEFEASMDETFRLITAGDFEGAEALDRGRVDPIFDLISGIIVNASADYSERAQQAQRASDAGTAFVVIAAGAMIGFLGLRFQNVKPGAGLIATEQKALRKAHDELEIRVQERTAELTKINKALEAKLSERKRADGALQHRIGMEKLIADISTRFINLSPDEIDSGINYTLQTIGEFADVDRSYVFMFYDSGTRMDNTHEWRAEGIEPQIQSLKGLYADDLPWFAEKIKRFETFHVPSVIDLPPEANAEKEHFQMQDIKSLIVVPMVSDASLIGFLGFDSVRTEKSWLEEDIRILKMVGEIFVNALEHKRVEESLKLFSEAVEETSNGVQITDLSGHIIYSNRAVEEICGFSPAEYKGKHVNEMNIDPEFASKVILPAIKETGRWAGELMVRHKDGHAFPIWLTASMIRDDKGEPIAIVGIITDITEQKQTEEALRESEEKFRSIIEQSGDGIVLTDEQGIIIEWNRGEEQIIGLKRAEVIGRTLWDMKFQVTPEERKTPENYERVKAKVLELIRTGQPDSLNQLWETDIQCPDGTRRTIQLLIFLIKTNKGFKASSISRDITEHKRIEEKLRRAHDELEIRVEERTAELTEANKALQAEIIEREQAEKSLKQSEEKYHTLVDNMQDGVFIIQDAKIQFVNEAFARMAGYTVEDVIGKDFREFVAPEDVEMAADRYYRRQAGEDVTRDYELRILHKDRRTRILTNMNIGLINYRGRLASMGTVKDITEKKKLEAQLLRAQRMESIGTLAGGIAHDLNNVLTPMMLSLQILQEKLGDEQSKKLLNILETNTQRGANLIKQVMSFVRGIEGEHTALQVVHIIAEIEKIAKETFPRSIEIRTDIQKDLSAIAGDATQLHQVLMNLCVNARDAMPQGGTLIISAENVFVDESYARMNLDARVGPFVTITVTDTGTGIAPETLSRIFEPFFTTKEFGKGTGLGLSTVLGIVKGHGGFIDVHSEVGKGTAFKVYLPAAKAETQKTQEQQQGLPSGHEELVFVVDDEADILEITRVSLEKHGYRVLTANDGEEAIRLYSQNMEEIKIVLMDMMMPVMDGPASIQAMRKFNPGVKIIGVSGLIEKDKIIEDADIHVHAFLTKPYTTRSLLRTIYEVLSMK